MFKSIYTKKNGIISLSTIVLFVFWNKLRWVLTHLLLPTSYLILVDINTSALSCPPPVVVLLYFLWQIWAFLRENVKNTILKND